MTITTIIFVDRDKIEVAHGSKIFAFPLPQTLVKDLGIVDRNLLGTSFQTFAQKCELAFESTLVVLSEAVCFVGEGLNLSEFITTLPFDNPVGVALGKNIIGTNKDLYEWIVEVVDKFGGEVKAVAPIFLSKETFGIKNLNENIVKYIFDNSDAYTRGYFSFTAPIKLPQPLIQTKAKATPLTYKLVGVFAFLAIVLIVVIFLSR